VARGPGLTINGAIKLANVKILDDSTPGDDYTEFDPDYTGYFDPDYTGYDASAAGAVGGGESGPSDAPVSDGPDFTAIFGAPDLTTLIGSKRPKTTVAREYERRANSVLKALTISAINTGNFPDAAAYLWHGPAFSTAVGVLADTDVKARKAIDLLTTPANPWATFLLTAIPLIAQVTRNHENQIKEIPKGWRNRKQRKAERTESPARFTLHLPFGKQIALRFRLRLQLARMFSGFRSQTHDPGDLAMTVFGNNDVQKALQKLGVNVHAKP
jgi:hypothetical protein